MAIKFLNNVAVDSDVLYVDTVNDRVGIGTTSPSQKLHVEGKLLVDGGDLGSTSGDSIYHAEITGARHHLDFKEIRTANGSDWNNTTYKLQMRVDSTNHQSIDFVSDASYAEHIDIYTGNQQFNTRFTSSGNVGIGTTSPAVKLSVTGTIYASGGSAWNGGGTEANKTDAGLIINEGNYIYTRDGSLYLRKLIGKGTDDYINIGESGTSLIDGINFYSGSGSPLYRWYNNTSEIMRLNSTGLGIGTTDPTARLHVAGNTVLDKKTILRLPYFNMGASSITDEYLVIARKYDGTNAQNATGIIGKIIFSRGSTSNGNDPSEYNINIQCAYTANSLNKLSYTGTQIFTSLDVIDISGTEYYALKVRTNGGGQSSDRMYAEGLLLTDGDSNIFTKVRSSDSAVTVVSTEAMTPDNLTQGQLDSRYVNVTGDTMTGDLIVEGNLTIGKDGSDPQVDMLYTDHASGPGWDTRIFIGKSDNLPNTTSFPTSTAAGGYGIQFQANSDGAFFGIEEYSSGNYRPIINWGDDSTDSPFMIKFNNTPKFELSSGGNLQMDGDLTVSGGDITLGGTGRIQGIDTVSANTDAVNKAYVDNGLAGKLSTTGKAADSDLLDGLDYTSFELYKAYTVDMSDTTTYAENTWYPVTIPVSNITRIKIEVRLNSGSTPSWSTHSNGFSLMLDWVVDGNGWGTIYTSRKILQWSERWANVTIVGGISQMSNSSTEVVYLRGGGKYIFHTSKDATITPRSSTYTASNQSVSPTTSIINDVFSTGEGGFAVGDFYAAGNVGIGTTDPDAKLEINGDASIRSTNKLYFGQSTTALGSWTTRTYANGSEHRFNAQSFIFNNEGYGSTEYLRITSTGNVGIGETNPQSSLHISGENAGIQMYDSTLAVGSDEVAIRMGYNSNYSSGIRSYIASSQPGVDRVNLGFHVTTYTSSLQSFYEAMTIKDNGNVGIGTTDPQEKLHVVGGIMRLDANTGGFYQYNTSGTFRSAFYDNGSSTQIFGDGNGSTPAITINGGNVGIGETNPSEKLHVSGSAIVTSNLYSSKETSGTIASNNYYRIIELNGGSGRGKCSFTLQSNGGSGSPFLLKGTVNALWSNSESSVTVDFNSRYSAVEEIRVVRNASANKTFVDVKMSAEDFVEVSVLPFANVSATAVDFTNVTTLPSGDTVETVLDVHDKAFALRSTTGTSEVDQFNITNDIKIGVGTPSPVEKIHLKNNGDVGIALENIADTSGDYWKLWQDNWNGSSNFTFNVNYGGTDHLTVRTDGKVGIGTTSPSEKLEVDGNVQIGSTTDAKLYMVSTGGNGNNERFFIEGYADGGTYGGGFKLSTRDDSNIFNTALTVNRNGDVGIGATNPVAKLHIDAPTGDFLKITESGADRLLLDSNGELILTPPPNWGAHFKVGQNVGAYQSAIQVGEGRTANGYSYIDFIGDTTYTDYGLRLIRNNTGANTTSQLVHRGTGNLELVSTDSGDIILNPNSGNVGIGETNPDDKLHVDGRIRATLGFAGADGSAKKYFWRSDNTFNSGTIWKKIGTYNSSGQSSRIMIIATGTSSYGAGQKPGKTTIIAQVNNNNLLEGSFWQEGMAGQYGSVGFISNSATSHDIYYQVGSYSEYAFQAIISDGTFSYDSTTVATPTFTRTASREWNVNTELNVKGGNVGIGNTSPAVYSGYKTLHVGNGSTGNIGIIKLGTGTTSDGPEFYPATVNGVNVLYFNTNSTTNVMTLNGSNVGIGTNTPGEKLEVNGDIRVMGTDNYEHVQFYYQGSRVGEIGSGDSTWLRINQNTNKNIYTPRYIRADNGFYVDGTTKGITGSGSLRLENCYLSASGDGNHIHVNCPTALIPEGTTTSTNTGLGTGSYKWKNVFAGSYYTEDHFVFGTSTSEGEYITRSGNDIQFVAGGNTRLTVDGDAGNVGIGTISPSEKLTVSNGNLLVAGDFRSLYVGGKTDTGNDGLRMSIDNAGGGYIDHKGSGNLHFRADNSTGASTRMVITSAGGVAINATSSLGYFLYVVGAAAKTTGTTWVNTSDERTKENIQNYTRGLKDIVQLQPRVFDYNGKGGTGKSKENIGLIAQEVIDVYPEAIGTFKAKLNEKDDEETDIYNLDFHSISISMINAIKELNEKVKILETRIQTLENNQ